jgi:hypothetical protein
MRYIGSNLSRTYFKVYITVIHQLWIISRSSCDHDQTLTLSLIHLSFQAFLMYQEAKAPRYNLAYCCIAVSVEHFAAFKLLSVESQCELWINLEHRLPRRRVSYLYSSYDEYSEFIIDSGAFDTFQFLCTFSSLSLYSLCKGYGISNVEYMRRNLCYPKRSASWTFQDAATI